MKRYLIILFILPLFGINAQKIGDIIKTKPNIDFPNNAVGIDLMIGEGGFGLGSFYRYKFTETFTGFVDFSISEFKHEREIERFDIFGYPLPIFGKKNRVFILPLNFGTQFRLFSKSLTDNLRPYISLGVGPTMLVTTPAQEEFFKAFGKARTQFGVGGYVGLGANFGLNSDNLTGINIRYYFIQLFNEGVEQYFDEYKKSLQQVSLTINLGIMY